MSGQGVAIRETAEAMTRSGWTVLFVCIPNTPHVGVIPIPTSGVARQRYPDIVAFKGSVLKLVEVEITLNDRVAEDIASRLSEQRVALLRPATWQEWRSRIAVSTGIDVPQTPVIVCELVVIRSFENIERGTLKRLSDAVVRLRPATDFTSLGFDLTS